MDKANQQQRQVTEPMSDVSVFLKAIYDDHTVNGSHRIKARQLLELLEQPKEIDTEPVSEGEIEIKVQKFNDNYGASAGAAFAAACKWMQQRQVTDKLVECFNCHEQVKMISTGEFCPKCMC